MRSAVDLVKEALQAAVQVTVGGVLVHCLCSCPALSSPLVGSTSSRGHRRVQEAEERAVVAIRRTRGPMLAQLSVALRSLRTRPEPVFVNT